MSTDNRPTNPLLALAQSRRQVAIGLVVAGLALAGVAGWWAVWGWPARAEEPKAADVKPEDQPKPPESKPPERTHSVDYLPAAAWAGLLSVLCFGSAAWVATKPVAPGTEATTVRTEALTFGATAGCLTVLLGLLLGFRWQESLFKWVNESDRTEARWVLIAACIFTAGLIIMFGSLQLGRAEERTNAVLRRALYGFNSVFLGLLLVILLVAANIVSFLFLPTTLVTNDSAFTQLAEPSKSFLHSLDRPVHVYLIMPENYVQEVDVGMGRPEVYTQLYSDCRGVLSQCEHESSHFHASYLSPGLDAGKIAALLERFKVADRDREQFGMWIAVGDNEDVTSFIPARDLVDVAEQGRNVLFVFQGESKLINELIYLTDARSKDVVYVTQDNGELALEPGGERNRRAMTGAAQYLRDKKVRVEILNLDEKDPKVPADAAAVLVPGPQQTIPADSPTAKALQEYLVPTKGGKPGKLLAYLPAFKGGATSKVAPTGLEPLLKQFGVEVTGNQMLMSVPQVQPSVPGLGYIPPDTMLGLPYEETGVSLERTLSQGQLLFRHARRVSPGGPGGAYKVSPLMGTLPFRPSPYLRGYWLEDDFAASAETTARTLAADPEQRRNRLLTSTIPLAVAVTEGGGGPQSKAPGKPRLLVYGSDTPIEDRPAFNAIPEQYRYLVLSDSLDWLREREANLGIPPKKESTYRVNKPASLQSLLLLVGMVLMGISALGVGVWLSRRR